MTNLASCHILFIYGGHRVSDVHRINSTQP
nr:MAG TPA: hypothetical protein [Caudoviricetes sp.]